MSAVNINFWNDGKAISGDGETGVYASKHVKSRYHLDVWPKLRPGDVTFHAGWTLHASFANDNDKTREVAAVSYVPDSVRTLPSLHFSSLYAGDEVLNGVRQKIAAEDVPPMTNVPTSVLPRIWPPTEAGSR